MRQLRSRSMTRTLHSVLLFIGTTVPVLAQVAPKSHPPLRVPPPLQAGELTKGPAYFVDSARGDDAHDGSKAAPWQTVNHAIGHLKAGDTLYLRGGVYYEN